MKNFYKISLSLVLSLVFGYGLTAQVTEYQFDNKSTKEGFSIEHATRSGLEVRHSLTQIAIEEISDNGYTGQQVQLNGIFLPAEAGTPNLPANSRFIAIPTGAKVSLNVKSYQKQTINNVDLMAAAPILADTDNTPTTYEKNPAIFGTNAFYPAEPFTVSEVMNFRGVDVVALTVVPFQYNPVTKELIVYHDVDLDINYEGGNGTFGEDRLRSRYFDPILENALMNYNQLPIIDYEARAREMSGREAGCEYLIVIPNNEDFRAQAEILAEYRVKQGISTQVMSLSDMGCTSTAQMKTYFHNAYSNWDTPPVAVLLFGDHNTNMSIGIPAETISHPSEGTCITDNQYADCTGDYLPDICFSRLVAANATEAAMMVSKTLEYEFEAPNMNASSYQNPITALGWQTERWFQICSEVVGGYWRQHGKTPQRINAIYSGSPGSTWSSNQNTYMVTNYFGPNGRGYIPAMPSELGGWTGGTAQQVVNAVNNGAFLLQHRDHGYTQGWGEPSFSTSNVNQMTNVGKLTFVMSINCQTGNFNASGNCLGEAFIRRTYNNQNAGAVGALCPTQTSYSFVNDTYVWGVFDLFDPQFMPEYGPYADNSGNWMPAFGNVAGKYFLSQSSWPSNPNEKRITLQMFTAHCDAFLRLYTQVPQNLTVTHDEEIYDGEGVFHITAPAGSVIALTKNGNTVLAVATATGSNQTITFAPQTTGTTIDVVVTKQDYLRYVDEVEVVNNRPVLELQNVAVNDGGNNQLDYNETAAFNMTIKNNGGVASTTATATLSTSSQYITVVTNQATFSPLQPGQSQAFNNIFSVRVANNVPDQSNIVFNMHIVSGEYSWDESFTVKAFAPGIKTLGVFTIHDDDNGNGRLDAGETAQIDFQFINSGHSTAVSSTATLSTTSQNLNITTASVNANNVAVGSTATVTFAVSVDSDVPMGEIARMTFNVACASYTDSRTVYTRMNLPIEDFESGDLSQFEWTNDATNPWTISTSDPQHGTYCLKSGNIGNNATSEITLNLEVLQNDTIEFSRRISCDQSDNLVFYIDGVEKNSWNGNSSWRTLSYVITAGTHTLKWAYEKDASVTNYGDCAYIDFIVCPPINRTNCTAGADQEICYNTTAQLDGAANGYTSLEWTTDGDGQFSDAHILNPVYTPGTQDIENGSVNLTLAVVGITGNNVSDQMTIAFINAPTVSMDSEATICFNETFTTSAEATLFETLSWTSNGDGTFEDANAIETVYTPGTQDIANGNVELTLTANGCGSISETLTLSITPSPSIEIESSASICGSEPVNLTVSVTDYESILWSTGGDGSFSDATSAETTYTPGSQDLTNGFVTLTISAEGCGTTEKNVTLTTHNLPTLQVLSSVLESCPNQMIDIELSLTGGAPYTILIANDENTYQVLEDGILHFNSSTTTSDYTINSITDVNGCNSIISEMFNITVLPIIATPEKPHGEILIPKDTIIETVYTIAEVADAEGYEWIMEPAEAGTLINGGTQATITWSTSYNGEVRLCVAAIDSKCGNTQPSDTLVIFSSGVGLDENTTSTMKVYPNPANDVINIQIDELKDESVSIIIYNILGESVLATEAATTSDGLNTHIPLNNLTEGTYFLTVKTSDYSLTRQIIIKK